MFHIKIQIFVSLLKWENICAGSRISIRIKNIGYCVSTKCQMIQKFSINEINNILILYFKNQSQFRKNCSKKQQSLKKEKPLLTPYYSNLLILHYCLGIIGIIISNKLSALPSPVHQLIPLVRLMKAEKDTKSDRAVQILLFFFRCALIVSMGVYILGYVYRFWRLKINVWNVIPFSLRQCLSTKPRICQVSLVSQFALVILRLEVISGLPYPLNIYMGSQDPNSRLLTYRIRALITEQLPQSQNKDFLYNNFIIKFILFLYNNLFYLVKIRVIC